MLSTTFPGAGRVGLRFVGMITAWVLVVAAAGIAVVALALAVTKLLRGFKGRKD